MNREKQKQQPHPGAAPQQYRAYSNNGTEGGGVGGGFNISRLPSGPSPASQDPGNKQQPQQSLPPGAMQMGYPPNPRTPQYNYRPQPQRPQGNMQRMGGIHQINPQGMPGGTVYATFPTGQMLSQNIVPGQVTAGPLLLPAMHYQIPGRHPPQSGQGGGNQGNQYFQHSSMFGIPQSLPPPYQQYPVYMSAATMRQPYTTPSSAPNQVQQQQQPNPQQTAVQSMYVEQVPAGAQQVAMSSLSGGPGGPNGTNHIMGPQAPSSLSLVQAPVQPGASMMQNPQQAKQKKPRSNAVPIIDPETGLDVLADFGKEPDGASRSTDSSASHTPQPQVGKENDDIKAKLVVGEFASKVAAAAFVPDTTPSGPPPPSAPPHEEEKERLNGPVDHAHEQNIVKEPSPVPPPAAPLPPQPLHPPAFVPTVSANTKSPPIELHPRVSSVPSVSAVVKQLPPGTSGPPHSAPHPTPSPVPQSPSPQPPTVVRAPSPVPVVPAPVVQPSQLAPAPAPAPALTPVTVRKPQPAQVTLQPDIPAPAKKAGKKEATPTPPVTTERPITRPSARPVTASTPPPSATATIVGPPPAPAELSRTAPAKTTNFSEQISFKNMGAPSSNSTANLAPTPAPVVAPAPVEEKGTNGETDLPVGKAVQRPKKKTNLNRKGVDKTGTEMDAFTEPPAPAPARDPTPPPREPTPPAPTEKVRPVENSTASVIEFFQRDEVEAEESGSVVEDDDADMDAMVAAKNEENAKVSAAAAAAAANNNNNISEANEDGEVEDVEVEIGTEENEEEPQNIKSMTIERTPSSANKTLPYSYKDGQWSPVNLEGKKVYDRDFLLEIKNSTLALKKPDCNLAELDIFRDKPNDSVPNSNRRLHGSSSMSGRGDNGPPPYSRSSSSSQRPMTKMSGRDRGGPPRSVGPSLSQSGMRGMKGFSNLNFMQTREPEPILHKDPNGWKPARLQSKDELSEEQKQIEKLQKQVRGILNKLTPQKFEKLVGQILDLSIDTEEQLKEMVNLVFEKAVDEPSFSRAYADLCSRLQKRMILKVEENQSNQVNVTFRKLLLNKCQEGFEKNKKDEVDIVQRTKEIDETADVEKKKELKLLLEEDERKIRRKSVGLVRFIGELYKLHMLTPKIMHGCISQLLSQVAEEQLECLCKLLTTIGKELERESGSKKEFDEYFAQMAKLAHKSPDSKVSSRIRFMLQDVIELRQKNWKPRRDENNPKTIEQIHKDAERDAAMESAMLSNMNTGSKGRHQGDRRNARSNQDNDGWQMSGKNFRPNQSYTNTVEPSKLLHFKNDAGDTGISLGGTNTFSQWTLGSSTKRGTGVEPSRSSQGNNFTNNKFALLSQAEDKFKPSYSSMNKGKVSGSTSLEKDRGAGMMRDRDRDDRDMRRMGSGPPSRETSRPRYAQPGHSPAGSLNRDRDRDFNRMERDHPSSRGFSQQPDNREATESRVPPAEAPELDEDEGQRKSATIFEEWCANHDVQETLSTVSDTFVGRRNQCLFVRSVMNKVIEGKPHTRTKFAELLVELLQDKKSLLTLKDAIVEFRGLIEFGDDMVVDIPFFWAHWGQIFAPLVESELMTFDDVKQALEDRPLKDIARVLSEIFKTLLLHNKTNLWTASNSKLTDFVPEGEIDNFIKSNNYWFLSSSNAEPSAEIIKHRETLVSILQGSDEAVDEACHFLDEIEGSVTKKAFVEIVTMAVIKASLKDGKVVPRQLSKLSKLIQKYVDNKEELELICLFAIKNLVMREDFLELIVLTESFRLLYDDSIISVEAFKKWREDTSIEPLESEGRLLATKSLEPFYVFLAEADDEEDES